MPPFAWVIRFGVIYLLLSIHCVTGFSGLQRAINLVTLGALIVTAVAGFIARRALRAAGGGLRSDTAGTAGRAAFMALCGIALSVLFFVMIVYRDVGVWVLPACAT